MTSLIAILITWAVWLTLVIASIMDGRRRGRSNSYCITLVPPAIISALILGAPRYALWIAIIPNGLLIVGTLVAVVIDKMRGGRQ